MAFLSAQIIARIGASVVVQLPGGSLILDDPGGSLQVGGSTLLLANNPTDAGGIPLGTWSLHVGAGASLLERAPLPGEAAPLRFALLGAPPAFPSTPFALSIMPAAAPLRARLLPATSSTAALASLGGTPSPQGLDALLLELQL